MALGFMKNFQNKSVMFTDAVLNVELVNRDHQYFIIVSE